MSVRTTPRTPPKRRAGELRDYDQAVAAVHTRMRVLLDALDDQAALAEVLESFRAGRAGVEANMSTVAHLMRPPGDPFHERLVATYPQLRRFLPRLIGALDLEGIASARPVLRPAMPLATGSPASPAPPAGRPVRSPWG